MTGESLTGNHMLQYKIIAVLIALGLLGTFITVHHLADRKVRADLEVSKQEVLAAQVQVKSLEDQLKAVTEDAAVLKVRLDASSQAILKVRADAALITKKLKEQKPPVDCKAAIQWSVENAKDLAW